FLGLGNNTIADIQHRERRSRPAQPACDGNVSVLMRGAIPSSGTKGRMSIYAPLFLQLEEFNFQGRNTGLYFHMHKHANRKKVVQHAAAAMGWDTAAARRLAFATWLAEVRVISEDPATIPRAVRIACPGGFEEWWQYRLGCSKRALGSGPVFQSA